MNSMRTIKVDKLTLNFGAGKDQNRLDKGIALLKMLSGRDPVKTVSKHRIPTWGLRLGLPIGCKITLRGKEAEELLARLIKAKENYINPRAIDAQGNFSIGIAEYLDVPGLKYDADIGILGFEAAVTLTRPGYRVKDRKFKSAALSNKHRITKEETQEFLAQTYGVQFTGDEQ